MSTKTTPATTDAALAALRRAVAGGNEIRVSLDTVGASVSVLPTRQQARATCEARVAAEWTTPISLADLTNMIEAELQRPIAYGRAASIAEACAIATAEIKAYLKRAKQAAA